MVVHYNHYHIRLSEFLTLSMLRVCLYVYSDINFERNFIQFVFLER